MKRVSKKDLLKRKVKMASYNKKLKKPGKASEMLKKYRSGSAKNSLNDAVAAGGRGNKKAMLDRYFNSDKYKKMKKGKKWSKLRREEPSTGKGVGY